MTPGAPLPRSGGGDDTVAFLVAPLATIGLVVIAVVLVAGARRARGRRDPLPAESGDNRLFGRPSGADDEGGEPPASALWGSPDWSLPRAAGDDPWPDRSVAPDAPAPPEPAAPPEQPIAPDDRPAGS